MAGRDETTRGGAKERRDLFSLGAAAARQSLWIHRWGA